MKKRVLMVVTSADRLANGDATGLWLEEFAVPYRIFQQAGFDISVVNPMGGETPIDPRSGDELHAHPEWSEAARLLRDLPPLDANIDPHHFDAIFLAGGHGTVVDLPNNPRLITLLTVMDRHHKIISAVCHGPVGFVGPTKEDGTPLVAGRTLTAFSDEEERAVGLDQAVPFLLESKLRELGAKVVVGDKFTEHVIRDGHWITGQNPPSSAKTAQTVVDALLNG